MEPAFTLSVGEEDRSDVLRGRLLSLRVVDVIAPRGDELSLVFDDRDNEIELPAHGAVIRLAIGYAGAELEDQGRFTVDETEVDGPPDRISVSAKSADTRESLKAHKSRSWRATTVGAIVSQVASEHGLEPQVDADLAAVTVDHRDQAGESDLHFVTRLGRDHDAVAAPKAGKLIFVPRGQAVSASGKALEPLRLDRADLTRWRMKNTDRAKHGRVRARHRDGAAAADAYVEAGGEEPTKTLRHPYASAALAGAAAHAEHKRLKRTAHGVELELPGRPDAFAGRPVELAGVRDGVDGRWIITRAEHDLDFEGGGFTTRLEATVDGLDADAGDGATGYGGDDADPTPAEEGDE